MTSKSLIPPIKSWGQNLTNVYKQFMLEIFKVGYLAKGWDGVSEKYSGVIPCRMLKNPRKRMILQIVYILNMHHQFPKKIKKWINGIKRIKRRTSKSSAYYSSLHLTYNEKVYYFMTGCNSLLKLLFKIISTSNENAYWNYIGILTNTAIIYLAAMGLYIPNNTPDTVLGEKKEKPKTNSYEDSGKFIDYKIYIEDAKINEELMEKLTNSSTMNTDQIATVFKFVPLNYVQNIIQKAVGKVEDVCSSLTFVMDYTERTLNVKKDDFLKTMKQCQFTPKETYIRSRLVRSYDLFLIPLLENHDLLGEKGKINLISYMCHHFMIINKYVPNVKDIYEILEHTLNNGLSWLFFDYFELKMKAWNLLEMYRPNQYPKPKLE